VRKTERHAMPTYELGAVERSFLRQSMDFHGGQRVFLGLRLKGPHVTALVVEKLPLALLLAQVKHPVLRCVAVQSKNNGLVWGESAKRIDVARFDHRTWEDVFHERSSLPFNQGELPVKGSTRPYTHLAFNAAARAAFIFARGAHDVDFVLQAEHAVNDGGCFPQLLHDMMTWMTCANAALPAHGAMPKPVDVAIDETLNAMLGPWTAWLRKTLVLGEVIKGAMFHNAPPYVFDDAKQADADMARANTTCFRTHVFSVADTVLVAEACKRARVKMTPAVTACFLEVQGEVLRSTRNDAFRLCVVSTVNTRDFLIPRMPVAALGPYIGSTGAHYTAYNFGASQPSGLARVLTTARDLGTSLVAEAKPERALLRASQMSWGLDRQPVSMNAPTLVVSSWSAKGPVQPTYGQGVTVDQALFSMQCNVNSWPTRAPPLCACEWRR